MSINMSVERFADKPITVATQPHFRLHNKTKTKPRKKRRQPGDGLADYQAYVQGDEFAARAAQLDAADSSLAW